MTWIATLSSVVARRNPVTVLRRSGRRFARRPRPMQIRTIAAVLATVIGLVVYLADTPFGSCTTAI